SNVQCSLLAARGGFKGDGSPQVRAHVVNTPCAGPALPQEQEGSSAALTYDAKYSSWPGLFQPGLLPSYSETDSTIEPLPLSADDMTLSRPGPVQAWWGR